MILLSLMQRQLKQKFCFKYSNMQQLYPVIFWSVHFKLLHNTNIPVWSKLISEFSLYKTIFHLALIVIIRFSISSNLRFFRMDEYRKSRRIVDVELRVLHDFPKIKLQTSDYLQLKNHAFSVLKLFSIKNYWQYTFIE